MEIIGRVTADATVSETKAGKKVVNFSIAINDTYKTKDNDEIQKIVTYVNCSYWINPGVATYLMKGTLVVKLSLSKKIDFGLVPTELLLVVLKQENTGSLHFIVLNIEHPAFTITKWNGLSEKIL